MYNIYKYYLTTYTTTTAKEAEDMVSIIAFIILSVFAILIIIWLVKRFTFIPEQSKLYIYAFLKSHLFTVHIGDPRFPFWQKLPVYPHKLFGLGFDTFMYSWTQVYFYEEGMNKIKEENSKEGRKASIYWKPQIKQDGYDEKGIPKDKSTRIIILRTEPMMFLNELEKWSLAAVFETTDNYRGWRLFTFTFKIQKLSDVVSKAYEGTWQEIASKLFEAKYRAYSKEKTYTQLQKEEMDDFVEPFITRVNNIIRDLGLSFKVSLIAAGDIIFHPDTLDLIDSLELQDQEKNKQEAEKVKAKTAEIIAEGLANAARKKTDAEAYGIIEIGKAKGQAKKEELAPVQEFIENTTEDVAKQNKSVFGENGLGGVTGTVVLGDVPAFDTKTYISTAIALDAKEKKGGTDDK